MSTTDPIQILITWGNRQPHWVREIVSIVLDHRRRLNETELSTVFDHCMVETEMAEGEISVVPNLSPPPSDQETEERLELTELSFVENVNLLARNQVIQFNPHMTVIYGENATGKSGYVRILKQLAAVRSAEAILPNVRTKAKNVNPEAKIGYKVGSDPEAILWRGERGFQPLDRISAFDAKSVTIHLNKNLEFEYLPQSLSLFQYVNESVTAINTKLSDHLNEKFKRPPVINYTFDEGSEIAKIMDNFDDATDIQRLMTLSEVSQDEQYEAKQLRKRINVLKAGATNSELEIARNDHALYKLLIQSTDAINDCDWTEYVSITNRISTAENDLKTLAKSEIQNSTDTESTSEQREHFIQSGQAYLEALGRPDYPIAGDQCIYCQQELGTEALDLLRRYREHLRNPIHAELDKAKTKLATLISSISNIDCTTLTDRIQAKIDASEQVPNETLQEGLTFVQKVGLVLPKMKSGSVVSATDISNSAKSVKRLAAASRSRSKEAINSLLTVGSEREEEISRLIAQLRPLDDRLALKSVVTEITQFVYYRRWSKRGEILSRTISNFGRSVTNESKKASRHVLNERFRKQFKLESQALLAPAVSLDFPGRKGTAARRKSITKEHQLNEILSEGEQKVIALADFLAEVETRRGSSPILFDDPVNSLDHRRVERIAERLYQLSEQHQVIVFTHNIWFASSLIANFEHDRSKRTIYRLHGDTTNGSGVVTKRSRDVADRRQDYTNQIQSLIAQTECTSIEHRGPIIANAYSLIRSWCEVVAEEDLLCNVFRRHYPNAMMTRLVDIKSDKLPDAIRVFSEVHQKACRATEAHSSTIESYGFDVPTIEELKEDWQHIQDARNAYNKDN